MAKPLPMRIAGTGSTSPARVMTNNDFATFLDTSDEWIVERTGIRERRVASNGEGTASMGAEAARRAMADAGMTAADIDLLICATITPELPFPATACIIQNELGMGNTPAFDLSAACSGFIYGLVVATSLLQTGGYRNILVIGSETMTRIADFEDRATCVLFGDGAGAAILSADAGSGSHLLHSRLYADGSKVELLYTPAGGTRMPASPETVERRDHFVKMKGREVYKFAVSRMQKAIAVAMAEAGVTADDISVLIPHQSNLRIIESIRQRLGLTPEQVYVNIDRYGNTSAASVPIALDEVRRAGMLKPGDLAMLIAVGGGMTWATALVRL